MIKLITLCFALAFLNSPVFADDSNQFEAELRALEQDDEATMSRVETLSMKDEKSSDTIVDTVSLGRSAILKEEPIPAQPIQKEIKTRRIRSR